MLLGEVIQSIFIFNPLTSILAVNQAMHLVVFLKVWFRIFPVQFYAKLGHTILVCCKECSALPACDRFFSNDVVSCALTENANLLFFSSTSATLTATSSFQISDFYQLFLSHSISKTWLPFPKASIGPFRIHGFPQKFSAQDLTPLMRDIDCGIEVHSLWQD